MYFYDMSRAMFMRCDIYRSFVMAMIWVSRIGVVTDDRSSAKYIHKEERVG